MPTKTRTRHFSKWWVLIALILMLVLYLNRTYAYFFDFLGAHEISPYHTPFVTSSYLPARNIKTIQTIDYFALGDSLTYGIGVADHQDTYPDQIAYFLAADKNVEFYNLAIPGETTQDLITDQLPQVMGTTPGYITLLIGENDVLTAVSNQQFKQNYTQILDQLTKNSNKQLTVMNIPSLSSSSIMLFPFNFLTDWRTQQFNSIIENLVAEKKRDFPNLIFINLYEQTKNQFKADPSLYSTDKFHPSAKGYKLWSQIINANLSR